MCVRFAKQIGKMDRIVSESRERSLEREFCHKLSLSFNRSTGRSGKPAIKWTGIQSWFQTRLPHLPEAPKNESMSPKDPECKEGEIIRDSLQMEFEAKSSKDGAWIHFSSSEAGVNLSEIFNRRVKGSHKNFNSSTYIGEGSIGKTPDIPKEILLVVFGPSKVYMEVIKKVINSTVAEYVEKEHLMVSKDLRV